MATTLLERDPTVLTGTEKQTALPDRCLTFLFADTASTNSEAGADAAVPSRHRGRP